MNNKPVAELLINDGEPWGCRYSDEGTYLNANGSRMDGWIPLYTHPQAQQWTIEAKFKQLTDEEIKQVWHDYQGTLIDFAKAILRKAQEK